MKHVKQLAGIALALCSSATIANATDYSITELLFNLDGGISDYYAPIGSPSISGLDLSGFNTATGLGSIAYQVSGTGSHYVGAFFDNEIDLAGNGYLNEIGSSHGSALSGQTWEIDEPGYGGVGGYTGDIYDDIINSALDNSVGTATANDVSMAMAWSLTLASGETADISWLLGTTAPTSGFYLQQNDPDSGASIYLSGQLTINGGGQPPTGAPDGGATLGTLLLGLAGLAGFQYKATK